MAEHELFELRLRAALDRYVADGPTGFDALEFARAVAAAEPRRHGLGVSLGRPRVVVPRFAWLLVAVALMIVALDAVMFLAGARPVASPLPWQRIWPPRPLGSTVQMIDVVSGANGYLAIGNAIGGSADTGVVWSSADGQTWDLVASGSVFTGAELRGVTEADDGYVAVGVMSPQGSWVASAWRSADGRTWRPVSSVSDPDQAKIDDVAYANGHYVAVGWSVAGNLVPRIWVSGDGDHWTSAADFAAEPSFMGAMLGVVAGGPGFVAVGLEHGVWTSPDGNVWTPVDNPGHTTSSWRPRDIVVGDDGRIVVIGAGRVVHVTGDAVQWTTVSLPALDGPGGSDTVDSVTGVAAMSWGFAAVSTHASSDQMLLWMSRDGTTWAAVVVDVVPSFRCGDCSWLLGSGDTLIVPAANVPWMLDGPPAGLRP